MSTYHKTFVICPHCEAETDKQIDHLFERAPTTAGPWSCDDCGGWFEVVVDSEKNVTLSIVEGMKPSKKTSALALLKRGDLFMVFWKDRYGRDDTQDSDRFFYEEHSCPTNWMKNCMAVVEMGDTDPHGFLKFVRSVDLTPEQKERLETGEHDEELFDLFPELGSSMMEIVNA